MQQHVIHKQHIIIRSRVAGTGAEWQRRINDQLQQQLISGLEALFDELAPPGVFLHIDTLHLDLGAIAGDTFGGDTGFSRDFVKKIVEGCRSALLERGDEKIVYVSPVEQRSAPRRQLESLIFFLEKGRLPWYGAFGSMADWERDILARFGPAEWSALADWLRRSLTPDGLPALLAELGLRPPDQEEDFGYVGGSPRVQRLIQQFSDKFLQTLVSGVLGGRRVISLALERAAAVGLPNLSSTQRLRKWEAVLALLLAPEEAGTRRDGRHAEPVPNAANPRSEGRARIEEEALYVEAAGLVLLHPFMERYLAELGLLSGKRFRDEAAACRATLLLHWLATGRTEAAEWELVLQKLLCGLAPESVVPAQLDPSPEEKTESENVLRSVLSHWAPLNRTSPDGLRDSFLQRQGKLVQKEGGWLLTIEKKTIDVLLGKLPWGFSTIRLPWMDGILHVEW